MDILLIEDEHIIRKAIKKLILSVKIKDFNINSLTEVEFAENSIIYLEQNKYDIIFTDIKCGEMTGLDLMKKYHKQQDKAEWVIISGYDSFEYAQQAILYDVSAYLLKPVSQEKIKKVITKCMNHTKEKQVEFISAKQIENFLKELEEKIWELNRIGTKEIINTWKSSIEKKAVPIAYYCDTLTYILETLFHNIEKKGSRLLQAFQWSIQGVTQENANILFLEQCLKIIDMLERQRKGNELDPIEVAKNFINENISKDISLDDVAHKLGLNSSYFSQLFKKETGQNFIQYRSHLRIEKAKELLLQRDIKVIDIPIMIGLNDHPHFTKTFKKHTGSTPASYRKKMGVQ